MDTLLWIMDICTVLQNSTNPKHNLFSSRSRAAFSSYSPGYFLVSSRKLVRSGKIIREHLGLWHGALTF